MLHGVEVLVNGARHVVHLFHLLSSCFSFLGISLVCYFIMAVESNSNETSSEKNVTSEAINATEFFKTNGEGEIIFSGTRIPVQFHLLSHRYVFISM